YAYQWDRNGNLTRRTQPNAQENFSYDAFNRLDVATLTAGGTTTPTLDMAYDPNGNITSKVTGGAGGGTGVYSYATTGGGPHAVSNISGNNGGTFHYDAAGNLDCRSWSGTACNAGSTTLWYSFNLPKRIGYSSTDTYADFSYGPNRERVRTTEHEGSAERVIYHVGPHFEVETSTAYTGTHYRATVFFGERAVYARVDGPDLLQEGYLHQDHLGSLDRVTAVTGSSAQATSFDAFGKRRNPDWSNDNTDARFADNQWLERGYTGHQQLDGVRLIHMNGRVQNPAWGRMLSPDPVVGDLTRPQSLNAYSYVMNNPLSYVDPTGFDIEEIIVTSGRRGGDDPCQHGICDPDTISEFTMMMDEVRLGAQNRLDQALNQLFFQKRISATSGKSRLILTGHYVAYIGPIHLAIAYVDKNGNVQTLSAAPRFGINGSDLGFLNSELDRPEDLLNFLLADISPPVGVGIDAYWQTLKAIDRGYQDDLDYDLFPELFSDRGYNSDSFVFGYIQGTGGTVAVDPSSFVGGATPIPLP
ncbi:MAG: RHS repeat-associated core domain-containing protein, partial [Gammaproteobacteria bacterium]|nr:RHS repeat-associated core domain-containing protein [Gammaproteobacteria bacterium]